MTPSTSTQTHSNTPSAHFSGPLFPHPCFISQARPLTSSLFSLFLSATPSSHSSITSVWLPVGSGHGEMYECGEKWMANSIKSIIPEAAPCYQQHCKGVLMHCLHAQPRPLPTPTEIKVVVVQGGGRRASQSHQRPERACFSAAVRRLPSPQGSRCRSGEKSSVRCQHHVQTRSESYQSVFQFSKQLQTDQCSYEGARTWRAAVVR